MTLQLLQHTKMFLNQLIYYLIDFCLLSVTVYDLWLPTLITKCVFIKRKVKYTKEKIRQVS